jgi:biotin operon repressor
MSWKQIGQDIGGDFSADRLGYSVSLSSNGYRFAVGAPLNDANGYNSGHVRVYDWDGSAWVKIGQDINAEGIDDWFGNSVSLSADGSRLAIGAHLNNGSGDNAGHVRVYDLSGNSWIPVGKDIDGEAAYDQSGWSVSLSADGSRVAIGARYNDGNGNNSGHVRVYELSGNNWIPVGKDIDGETPGDQSGYSVSLSADGSRLAIGAINNVNSGSNSGHVRVYELSGNSWIPIGDDIDGEAAGDQSGYSVSLSADGSRVAIGTPYNDGNGNNSGHVRVYELSGNSWIPVGEDIDGEAANDQSGWSVSLSADGSRVAIGARYNDGNGNNSGHVRVYELSGNSWIPIGDDIDGKAASDQSGYSVSLSARGSRLAIGAINNVNSGSNSGHVRVYQFVDQPKLSNFPNISKVFGNFPFDFTAPTSNSNGTFTYISSNTSVATISGSTITILGFGETTITATQSATNEYTSGSITATLTISKTNANILKQNGYTAKQLKDAGYTLVDLLLQANYTITELKQGGFVLNHNVISWKYNK